MITAKTFLHFFAIIIFDFWCINIPQLAPNEEIIQMHDIWYDFPINDITSVAKKKNQGQSSYTQSKPMPHTHTHAERGTYTQTDQKRLCVWELHEIMQYAELFLHF